LAVGELDTPHGRAHVYLPLFGLGFESAIKLHR
jgi:hypothetical protein